MTTTTIRAVDARGAIDLDRLALGFLLALVGTLQVSIALANICLAGMLLCWAATLIRDRAWPTAPRFFLPLAIYAGTTLVASVLSIDPAVSIVDSKQLALFLIVPAVFHVAQRQRGTTILDVIVSVGAVSATFGIIQYAVLHYDSLGQRPQGTLSHYMTYSGLLMLVISTAVARLVFARQGRTWPALVMPALVIALALTLGRAAWVGAAAGVGLLLMLKDVRLTVLLPTAMGLLLLLAPHTVTSRALSMFDPQDPTTQDRLAMMEIGVTIVRDHPLTGVGPNMVPHVYPDYRPDYAVNPVNLHLHNVPLQIAAERGLPALAAWMWFIGAATAANVRLFRRTAQRTLPAAALAAIAAMLTAGLFEYNFGDSEFLMLFLILITLPFAGNDSSRSILGK